MGAAARMRLAEPVHLLAAVGRVQVFEARRAARSTPARPPGPRPRRGCRRSAWRRDPARRCCRRGGCRPPPSYRSRPARADALRSKQLRPAGVVRRDSYRLESWSRAFEPEARPSSCRCSRGPRGSRRLGRGRRPRSGSRRCRGGWPRQPWWRAIASSSASSARARPSPRWAGATYMLLTSATAVSRWRTPPSAAGAPSSAGEQEDAGRGSQLGRRPRRDLGLEVDAQRPVRLADEGVEEGQDLGIVGRDLIEGQHERCIVRLREGKRSARRGGPARGRARTRPIPSARRRCCRRGAGR